MIKNRSPFLIKRTVNIIKKATLAILLVIISLFSTIFTPVTAFAQENSYEKTPLTELSKADNFNVEDFEEDPTDYSLKVIQVAESAEGKLNIFTFQPARNTVELWASSINISYGFSSNGENLTPKNYSLKLISTEGCFDKYEVEGFDVPSEEYKYYNIVSIYRRLSEDVPTDEDITGGTTTEKAYEVGQQWSVHTINGVTSYKMNTFMTKTITQNLNGTLYYSSGLHLGNIASAYTGGLHSWFVAFDVEDTIVKHIYNATLTFQHRTVHDVRVSGESKDGYPEYGDWVIEENYSITDADEVTYSQVTWFGDDFQWNRIMSSTEYVTNAESQGVTFSEEARAEILASQWVFAYYETEYRHSETTGFWVQHDYRYSEVENLSILTLKYMDFSGNVYDVGIVSDKTTADDVIDGYAEGMLGLQEKMKEIAAIISSLLGLVGLLILANFCPPLFNVLIIIFKAIFNGFIWVLSFVFEILTIPLKLIFNTKRK